MATFLLFYSILEVGDRVVDVGAHLGVYSYLFSYFVKGPGRVFSFEPNPYTCRILRRRLKGRNVEIYQRAAYEKSNQKVRFRVEPYKLIETSKIHDGSYEGNGGFRQKYKDVEAITFCLDDLIEKSAEAIKLIKIDVEGFEISALKGAKRLIERDMPIIYFEYGKTAGIPRPPTVEFLEPLDYLCFDSQTLEPIQTRFSEDAFLTDVIAIPREKMAQYINLLDSLRSIKVK